MYVKRYTPKRIGRRRGLSGCGFGDFTDSDQCSTIPMGDPYRKPGNYCATPDGGIVTFNSDGSVVRTPGGVDPDPAHPVGSGQAGGSGFFDTLLKTFMPGQGAPVPVPMPAQTGMSTTTIVALAGGAVVLAMLLARR